MKEIAFFYMDRNALEKREYDNEAEEIGELWDPNQQILTEDGPGEHGQGVQSMTGSSSLQQR